MRPCAPNWAPWSRSWRTTVTTPLDAALDRAKGQMGSGKRGLLPDRQNVEPVAGYVLDLQIVIDLRGRFL